jgi:hypothetical protein
LNAFFDLCHLNVCCVSPRATDFPAFTSLLLCALRPTDFFDCVLPQARDISTDLAFSHEAVWAEQELAGTASEVGDWLGNGG